MILPDSDDTIVAIATPPGRGGIGVIRISGGNAFEVTTAIIAGNVDFAAEKSHTVHHCFVKGRKQQSFTDEVLISVFRQPTSYTGEDVVEISAHGNPVIMQQIVEMAISAGARQAVAGEFTMRAFQNGKIDLLQAESVADLIAAEGEAARRAARYQLAGKLSQFIDSCRQSLLEIAALFEAYTDFPEEEIPEKEQSELITRLDSVMARLRRLAESYNRGRLIREGVKIPIVGPSNAGKSSLFNAILTEERAIVTDIPGTTRDTISESVDLGGLAVRFIDTAGLRESGDQVELIGVERSHREISGADIVILVLDASLGKVDNAAATLDSLKGQELVVALNKTDLIDPSSAQKLKEELKSHCTVLTSAKELTGIDHLLDAVKQLVERDLPRNSSEHLITNERHFRAITVALDALNTAKSKMLEGVSFEFPAFDLRQGINQLEELLGKVTTDDLLAEIFSRFCIGK